MNFELKFCESCYQMTNHLNGVCQKCLPKKLTFEQQLYNAHRAILFPEEMNKNTQEFLSMIIQRLLDKTEGMTDDQIEKFLGY